MRALVAVVAALYAVRLARYAHSRRRMLAEVNHILHGSR